MKSLNNAMHYLPVQLTLESKERRNAYKFIGKGLLRMVEAYSQEIWDACKNAGFDNDLIAVTMNNLAWSRKVDLSKGKVSKEYGGLINSMMDHPLCRAILEFGFEKLLAELNGPHNIRIAGHNLPIFLTTLEDYLMPLRSSQGPHLLSPPLPRP